MLDDNRTDYSEQANLKTPVKAIRAKCLDCCEEQWSEVENCTAKTCPLYPYRMGRKPLYDGQGRVVLTKHRARKG